MIIFTPLSLKKDNEEMRELSQEIGHIAQTREEQLAVLLSSQAEVRAEWHL